MSDPVKQALLNLSGRDNRTPHMGNTQFPTEGSKAKAQSLHDNSVEVAEVGPAPLTKQLDKTHINPLKEVTIKMPTAQGSLPIVKEAQSRYAEDPLVQYLKKHAQQVDTNIDKTFEWIRERSLTSCPTDFRDTPAEKKMKEQDEQLKAMFKNYTSSSPKV